LLELELELLLLVLPAPPPYRAGSLASATWQYPPFWHLSGQWSWQCAPPYPGGHAHVRPPPLVLPLVLLLLLGLLNNDDALVGVHVPPFRHWASLLQAASCEYSAPAVDVAEGMPSCCGCGCWLVEMLKSAFAGALLLNIKSAAPTYPRKPTALRRGIAFVMMEKMARRGWICCLLLLAAAGLAC
jgi:hypothetical protein